MSISAHIKSQGSFPGAYLTFNVMGVNIQDVNAGANYTLPLGLFPEKVEALKLGADNTPKDYTLFVVTQSGAIREMREAIAAGDLPTFSVKVMGLMPVGNGNVALRPLDMFFNEVPTAEQVEKILRERWKEIPEAEHLKSRDVLKLVLDNMAGAKEKLPVMVEVEAAYRKRWADMAPAAAN